MRCGEAEVGETGDSGDVEVGEGRYARLDWNGSKERSEQAKVRDCVGCSVIVGVMLRQEDR